MSNPRKILIVVEGDPRTSHRPAEAIRLAAGVAGWRKVDVSILLCGDAVWVLDEWPEDLIDGDHIERYLPSLGEGSILVEKGNERLAEMTKSDVSYREADANELAQRAAAAHSVMRF